MLEYFADNQHNSQTRHVGFNEGHDFLTSLNFSFCDKIRLSSGVACCPIIMYLFFLKNIEKFIDNFKRLSSHCSLFKLILLD